jgi:hypothetical protein
VAIPVRTGPRRPFHLSQLAFFFEALEDFVHKLFGERLDLGPFIVVERGMSSVVV